MVNASIKRAARRAHSRLARDVTIRNYERTESGGRESWSPTTQSPETIPARVERTTRSDTDRSLRESGEPEADVTVYIESTDALVLTSGESETIPAGETRYVTDVDVASSATLTINGTLVVGFIDAIRDGGGEGATEIDVDGNTYVVIRRDVQDNGLYALDCERVS